LGASGKPKLAVQKLDELLAKASGEDEIEMRMLKLQISAAEKMPGAEKAFFEIAELANSAGLQNSSAWAVVQMRLDGTAVSPQMVAKARKAIEIQTQAFEMAREPQLRQRLAKFLSEWQALKMSKQ